MQIVKTNYFFIIFFLSEWSICLKPEHRAVADSHYRQIFVKKKQKFVTMTESYFNDTSGTDSDNSWIERLLLSNVNLGNKKNKFKKWKKFFVDSSASKHLNSAKPSLSIRFLTWCGVQIMLVSMQGHCDHLRTLSSKCGLIQFKYPEYYIMMACFGSYSFLLNRLRLKLLEHEGCLFQKTFLSSPCPCRSDSIHKENLFLIVDIQKQPTAS